jgi:hypothetical protein
MAKTGANDDDKPQGLSLQHKQQDLTWRQSSETSSEPQALAAEPQAEFVSEAPVLHPFHEVRRGSIRAPNHPHGRSSVCGLLLDYCDMYMLFDGGRPGLKTQLLSKYVRQLHLIKDEETYWSGFCKRSTA